MLEHWGECSIGIRVLNFSCLCQLKAFNSFLLWWLIWWFSTIFPCDLFDSEGNSWLLLLRYKWLHNFSKVGFQYNDYIFVVSYSIFLNKPDSITPIFNLAIYSPISPWFQAPVQMCFMHKSSMGLCWISKKLVLEITFGCLGSVHYE